MDGDGGGSAYKLRGLILSGGEGEGAPGLLSDEYLIGGRVANYIYFYNFN